MKLRLLAVLFALLPAAASAAERNPFFAMDTIAKGGPDVVVPLLKELGYDGLGGRAGDRAMAEALHAAGLTFFNGYLTLALDADQPGVPPDVIAKLDAMRGLHTTLWLAITKVVRKSPANSSRAADDEIVAARVKAIADAAAARGVKLALYPHTGQYLEHFEDALKMVNRLNHPAVGVTFNLCHWLRVEGSERDPIPLLRAALPRLMFVTINGADAGDTKTMSWDRLILPLGEGSYDVTAFVRNLRAIGYTGPVGFQGYGIKAPAREVLAQTMAAWKKM